MAAETSYGMRLKTRLFSIVMRLHLECNKCRAVRKGFGVNSDCKVHLSIQRTCWLLVLVVLLLSHFNLYPGTPHFSLSHTNTSRRLFTEPS